MIQRTPVVAPFSVKTPFITPKGKKSDEVVGSSGVEHVHIKFFQSVEAALNNSAQLSGTIPTSSNFPGQPGNFTFDANWLYVCVGLNIWRRIALTSW